MPAARTDIDAERATLGAMMMDDAVITGVLELLGETPEAFVDTRNQAVYTAIVDLYRDGDRADIVTIPAKLRDNGEAWPDCTFYVAGLMDATPTSHNSRYYAGIVRRLHGERQLEIEIQNMLAGLRNGQLEPEDVRQRMSEISSTDQAGTLTPTCLVEWPRLAKQEIESVFKEGLALGRLGVLTAEGGTGKSFLALQLALSVALGREIVKGFAPTGQGRVLCCFGEDDDQVVAQRIRAIVTGLKMDERAVSEACSGQRLHFINGVSAPLLSVDRNGQAHRTAAFLTLRDQMRRENYRLVIIDPLVSWAGIENENDNAAMQVVASALIELAVASGGAVLVLHHSNKAGTRTGDLGQASARGASSLLCAARWVAAMRTLDEKDAKRYSLDAAETHQYCEVYVSKNSYAPRSGTRTTLHRVHGGALRSVDLSEDRAFPIAQALAICMGRMPRGGGLTDREICRGKASEAVKLREAVALEYGAPVGEPMLRTALNMAIEANLIERKTKPVPGVGRPREACYVSEF